jgi:hypothetical protein
MALRAALVAGSLLAAAPLASARAQDRAPEMASIDRLKFEAKCVFEIREWKGKGAEEPFLARLQAQRGLYEAANDPRLPALVDLLAEGLWSRKTEFEAKDEHDRASAFAADLKRLEGGGERTKALQLEAEAYIVDRNYKAAEAALRAGDVATAKEKYRNLLPTAKGPEAASVLFDIEWKASGHEAVAASGNLDAELESLDRLLGNLEATLGADLARGMARVTELRDRKSRIENETQLVAASFFDASAAVAPVRVGTPLTLDAGTATFALVPLGEGAKFPVEGVSAPLPAGKPLRHFRGTYDIRVYAPGNPKPVAVFVRQVLGDAPLTLQVPDRVPEGMVYCAPGQGADDALFADRTEVTVTQVKAVAGADALLQEVVTESSRGLTEAEAVGLPAWVLDEKHARAFEKASGKAIPTAVQWLRLGFGPYSEAERRYPWGSESPTGAHAYADPASTRPEPRKVGGREAGASPFGLEDLAGNLAEWVRYGSGDRLWIVGGHHQMPYDALARAVRNPMPGLEAWGAMAGGEQNTWKDFRFKNDEASYASGLRMVVPVRVPK